MAAPDVTPDGINMTVVGDSLNITFTQLHPHPTPGEERQSSDLVTVRLPPIAVKLLHESLTEVLSIREKEYGEIQVPPDAIKISKYSVGDTQ